jgi:DAK2 domain fusion protein YloV
MIAFNKTTVLRYFDMALQVLGAYRDKVDELNVYPVPDGDTATNMFLTLQHARNEVNALPDEVTHRVVGETAVSGLLSGSRGNSGVISSQGLRGIFEVISRTPSFGANVVQEAFECAAKYARASVLKPVEGTMVTTFDDMARAARNYSASKMEVAEFFSYLVDEAYKSVDRTPSLMPLLKENNVVDAGSLGWALVFEGFYKAYVGDDSVVSRYLVLDTHAKVKIEQLEDGENSQYRYCLEFLVHTDEKQTIRRDKTLDFLSKKGDSVQFVGYDRMFKIHVHTDKPHSVLKYFERRGTVTDVHRRDMNRQKYERLEKLLKQNPKNIGVVVVASGTGIKSALSNLGADIIVDGGQTRNPSMSQLLSAINIVGKFTKSVIVFANNKNVWGAARNAIAASKLEHVYLFETYNVLQSMAALEKLDDNASLRENVAAMQLVLDRVQVGEITTAEVDRKLADGVFISKGLALGLVDGKIVVVRESLREALLATIQIVASAGMIVLFYGEGVDEDCVDEFYLQSDFPDLDVEIQYGGQSAYPFVMMSFPSISDR